MTIAAKARVTDMPIKQQAQMLGFQVAGQLVRRRDKERSARDQVYEDAAGNAYFVRRGILTIVAADGTVY
jgi:hypothetical protein